MSAVRWTCYHPEDREYCNREHKSEKAAEDCAKRIANANRDSSGWETLEVEKGFYANGEHEKQ